MVKKKKSGKLEGEELAKISKRNKGNRRRGHSYERQLAIEMRDLGFPGARRQLEYHEKDANGVDLQGTGIFKIQSKKCKTYVPVNTINEIQLFNDIDIPILVTAGDGQKPMAVLPWADLKILIRAFMKGSG